MPNTSAFKVSGTIALEYGLPASKIKVKAYHVGFGGTKTLLGEVATDEKGYYELPYTLQGRANLELHTVGADEQEVQLSLTKFGASCDEQINLVAPSSLKPPEAEFTRLCAAVSAHLGESINLKDSVEKGRRRDISALSTEIGWDGRALALAAEAYAVSELTGIPAEGLYAFSRLGLPIEARSLTHIKKATVEAALYQAAEASIIDSMSIEKSIVAFENFAAKQRLLSKAPGVLSNAQEFINNIKLVENDEKVFTKIIKEEDTSDIWSRAKEAGLSKESITKLKLQGKLAFLTLNNAALTDNLLNKVKEDPRELIPLGFYEEKCWADVLKQEIAGNNESKLDDLIPPAFKATSTNARLEMYCRELARRVCQMNPHDVTVHRILNDKLSNIALKATSGVKTFLSNAVPRGFRLGQKGVGAFINSVEGGASALLPDMSDLERDGVLNEVRTLYSLFSVSPSDEVLDALLGAGFKSATEIAGLSYKDFSNIIGNKGKKSRDAVVTRTVYWKAQQTSATVFNALDGLKRINQDPGGSDADRKLRDDQRRKTKDKLKGLFPTLDNLFGTVDFCECEGCRSVLSPAAYLVDLLHFIDPKEETWRNQKASYENTYGVPYLNERPYNYLLLRRPDIQDIPLTCGNTMTTLPYIDIVNEILERVVVGGTKSVEAFDTGEANSEDLIAEPQHITWEAYVGEKGLQQRVYPLTLPFDLPLEMVRAFCKQLDLPLWQLRERIVRPSKLNASADKKADGLVDVWFERLGLGPSDIEALIRTNDWYELYGYSNENDALRTETINITDDGEITTVNIPAPDSLQNAKTLATRLGVTYKELTELVRTQFVNPGINELEILNRLQVEINIFDGFIDHGASLGELGARLAAKGVDPEELRPLRSPQVRQRTLRLRWPSFGSDFGQASLEFDTVTADTTQAMKIALLRLNLFVRLQKRLGWETHELDRALMVLVPEADNRSDHLWEKRIRTALIYLSHVKELVDDAKGRLTNEDVLVLWADIPTNGVESLYHRLFEDPAVLGQDPVFAMRLGNVLADNKNNEGKNLEIADHIDVLRHAFQLNHEEIEPILAVGGASDRKLSIKNLSILMRHKIFAKALDISVLDLVAFLYLIDHKPFAKLSSTPLEEDVTTDTPWTQTLEFVREVWALKEIYIDAIAIERICRHRGVPDEIPPKSDPALVALEAISCSGLEEARRRLDNAEEEVKEADFAEQEAQNALTVAKGLVATSTAENAATVTVALERAVEAEKLAAERKTLAHNMLSDAKNAEKDACDRLRNELIQTLTAQLSFPEVLTRKLVCEVLTHNGDCTFEESFFDKGAMPESLRKLRKAVDLIQTLGISKAELEYLLNDASALNPNKLPLSEVVDDEAARDTFTALSPWIALAKARKRFGSTERLLNVFSAAKPGDTEHTLKVCEERLCDSLAALTGRPSQAIATALAALGLRSTSTELFEVHLLTTPGGVCTFVDALATFMRLGLDPVDVAKWAGEMIDASVAQKIRASVKGRYSPTSWRSVAKPIFDTLRRKQRDALVSYMTTVTDSAGVPIYGETQEKLFEHLLLDPGTQPIVLASRIQLAISSVQLYVQRCLMSLEDKVLPEIINAERWDWMRRYRVWEVNRKFFIWPENWLDPEFRDDKTHLFRELETSLLKADVNDDVVRGALQKYIEGLETIARLEMLTMYCEPGISGDGVAVHVVARTHIAPFKYFYRQCSHGMWSPWEPIDVGIEGDHLVLAAWRGRMHLFWVSFLQKAVQEPIKDSTGKELSLKTIAEGSNPSAVAADSIIQLQLHWAENIRGKWTNRSSTPTFEDAPGFGTNAKATTPEEKGHFFVHAKLISHDTSDTGDDDLEVHIVKGKVGRKQVGDKYIGDNYVGHKYLFRSKLAPPVLLNGGAYPEWPILSSLSRTKATKWLSDGPLEVSFTGNATQVNTNGVSGSQEESNENPHRILNGGEDYTVLLPSNEKLPEPDMTLPPAVGNPSVVFFRSQNARYVFYRGTDRAINALWASEDTWYFQSPTADALPDPPTAGDPEPAESDPHAYALDDRGLLCAAYTGKTTVVELSWAIADAAPKDAGNLGAGWSATTLYVADDPNEKPVGRPVGGLFSPARGVVFRTASGRILAAVEDGDGWKFEHLNADLPKAASDPKGFIMTRQDLEATTVVSRHLYYIGQDGHVYEVRKWASSANWSKFPLTNMLAAADLPAPNAALNAYGLLQPRVQAYGRAVIIYRRSGGGLHMVTGDSSTSGPIGTIHWQNNKIEAQDLDESSDIIALPFERNHNRSQHIFYRDKKGGLRGLRNFLPDPLFYNIPTSSLASGAPAASVVESGNRVFLCYVDQTQTLRALSYDGDNWRTVRFDLANPFPDEPISKLSAPFFFEDAERPHTFFVEPYLLETAVHEWTEWIVTTKEYAEPKLLDRRAVAPFFPHGIEIIPSDLSIISSKTTGNDLLFSSNVLVRARGGIIGKAGGGTTDISASSLSQNALSRTVLYDPRRGIDKHTSLQRHDISIRGGDK